MELFYAYEAGNAVCRLDADESAHCVRVLRHRAGDEIDVMDGEGTLYHCRLADDNPKGVSATVLYSREGFGGHPYHLTIGCCPTKSNERFEWFVEKATELGIDRIVPLIGEHSERKVYKSERAARIALSAAKQSLKARIPEITEPVRVKDFLREGGASLRLIAYCFEDPSVPRIGIREALEKAFPAGAHCSMPEICVLIGPEGDFSPEEASLALQHGYLPVHLGPSRLRTETAAVTATTTVYLHFQP